MVTTSDPTDGNDGAADSPWSQPGSDDDYHRHLTTLDGWRHFTTATYQTPDLLPGPQWKALTDDQRVRYDEARLNYHTHMTVVATSTLQQVVNAGRRLALLNRHTVSARRGLILSGSAGTGKTTAMTQLGKTHENTDRLRHPGLSRIPVIYVTAPPAATPRMLAVEFARFLGLPITHRANMTDVIEAVCGVAVDARVTLVCVDEIHNFQLATRQGADVSDTLKYFSERIPATFVYAGIDVVHQGLFTGIRGRQIAGRFSLIETVPFPLTTQWHSLVATLEQALRLHHNPSGTLPKISSYLHQRTGGMIGSLLHLVRGGAIDAILTGTERLTKTLLENVELDHAADSRRPHIATEPPT